MTERWRRKTNPQYVLEVDPDWVRVTVPGRGSYMWRRSTLEADYEPVPDSEQTVYLAGRYVTRETLAGYAEELRVMGYTVTSRWLDGHELPAGYMDDGTNVSHERLCAREDVEDIQRAGIVISFTEKPHSDKGGGGRHVEFGIALASGQRSIVVGHRENVFHALPQVEFYPTWDEARAVLAVLEGMEGEGPGSA